MDTMMDLSDLPSSLPTYWTKGIDLDFISQTPNSNMGHGFDNASFEEHLLFNEEASDTLNMWKTGPELVPKTAPNRRYKCTQANCDKDFARTRDRDRHIRTIHDVQVQRAPKFNCTFPGCNRNPDNGGRGFTRQDKLNEHLRNVHRHSVLAVHGDDKTIVTSAPLTDRTAPKSIEPSRNAVNKVGADPGKSRTEAIRSKRTLAHQDYSIIWVCTNHIEYVAAQALLDEEHEHSTCTSPRKDVICTLGNIQNHNIVVVMISSCGHNSSSTATVIQDMLHSFHSIRMGLIVGIAGGLSSQEHEIRLGDIVVGAPRQERGGELCNDWYGNIEDQRLRPPNISNHSEKALTTAVMELEAQYTENGHRLETTIRTVLEKNPRLGQEFEDLYRMDLPDSIPQPSQAGSLTVHYDYGLIASAREPMRDAIARKRIVIDQDILGSETGAAALANRLPCLVVRGICDFLDRQNPGKWQGYAAMAAAAYSQDLLGAIPPTSVRIERPLLDTLYDIGGAYPHLSTVFREPSIARREDIISCRRDLFLTDPFEDKKELNRRIGNRALGTCEWILGTKEFDAWVNSGLETEKSQGSQLLWMYGNPGAGKSIAASFLAEKLPTMFPEGSGKTVAYFFCSYSFEERRKATSIIRGLLFQLVQQHPKLLGYILPRYEERGAELFESFESLWAMFMNAATDEETGHKYCIIDALDECDQVSQEVLLQRLGDLFQGSKSLTNLRILITSRPHPEICYYLEDFTNMDLASFPCMEQDIDLCIEENLARLTKKKHYTNKVREEVKAILKSRAEGTFLWLGLACKDLSKIPSRGAVRFLQDIPEGLDSLYNRLLNEALGYGDTDRTVTRRILGLLAVCLQPLSVLELAEVCQLHQNEEDEETRIQFTRECIAYCRLMVIIQDKHVSLLHQSLRDFLLGPRSRHLIDEFETHAFLAHRCIDVLIENFYHRDRPNGYFSGYASRHWVNHARLAKSKFQVKDSEAEFFALHSPCREHWLNSYRHHSTASEMVPQQFSLLHIAAKWDIPALMNHTFGSDNDHEVGQSAHLIDCVDDSGATPLEYAASLGHTDLVAILLSLGAKVTSRVLCTLTTNSEDVDREEDEIVVSNDMLKAAAGNVKSGKEVIALLLDRRGDEITITDDLIKADAGNVKSGKDVIELPRERRGDEITITDDVVDSMMDGITTAYRPGLQFPQDTTAQHSETTLKLSGHQENSDVSFADDTGFSPRGLASDQGTNFQSSVGEPKTLLGPCIPPVNLNYSILPHGIAGDLEQLARLYGLSSADQVHQILARKHRTKRKRID